MPKKKNTRRGPPPKLSTRRSDTVHQSAVPPVPELTMNSRHVHQSAAPPVPEPSNGQSEVTNPLRNMPSGHVQQSTAPLAPEPMNLLPVANFVQVRPTVAVPVPENLTDNTYPPSGRVDRVIIKHPGYEENNDLLSFYVWDNGTNGMGIHFATVILACGIVACNEYNGYISVGKDGSNRITAPDDYLVPPGEYYFHVRDGLKYPVFPSFRDWIFPHKNVPRTWVGEWSRITGPRVTGENVNSVTSLAVTTRDTKCCISAFRDGIERAHLCPKSEKDWFNINNMQSYNSTMGLSGKAWIDDRANSISLRSDIHGIFDAGVFAIVRKNNNWVVHFLNFTNELGSMYHNRAVDIHEGVSPHFLLARFAWAIFRFATGLFGTSETRLVRLRAPNEPGRIHDRDIPGIEILEMAEKAEGKEDETGGEKDSGGPLDDEATLVAMEASLGSAKDIQLASLTPVKTTLIPDVFSKFDRYIAEVKRQALLKQRPNKPELMCCDYEAADKAADLGLPINLCDACSGLEVPNLLDDSSLSTAESI
jgi:HNH endonuclease